MQICRSECKPPTAFGRQRRQNRKEIQSSDFKVTILVTVWGAYITGNVGAKRCNKSCFKSRFKVRTSRISEREAWRRVWRSVVDGELWALWQCGTSRTFHSICWSYNGAAVKRSGFGVYFSVPGFESYIMYPFYQGFVVWWTESRCVLWLQKI